MLSPETIETVKSTVPLLQEHGGAITKYFYQTLFEQNPELKNVFNQVNQQRGEQPRALADAVLAYANNIDNLAVILPAVARIANKHASLGIQPEQYPIVGANLLAAIQKVLDLPLGHPALVAWGEAYGVLADVFIDAEEFIYKTNEATAGGWRGFREFVISDIVEETPEVKSFYLIPADGAAIPAYKAGQYVGLKANPEASEFDEIRQYSLSGNGGEAHLRITTKSETHGLVSNHLHQSDVGTTVFLQAPTGVFTLNTDANKHLFIAGGVGITPMISMLYEALRQGVSPADIMFVQCARNEQQQIFKEELQRCHKNSSFAYKTVVDEGLEADHQGYLNQEVLTAWLAENNMPISDDTHVYFCGPQGFMAALNSHCKAIGFNEANIHYETFGPSATLS
ncbi:nitric oxide dioxygenase [Gammaproteobacteria bacterium 45_16_T64]|nr:nitric oxide dioxygenase [Gammaproteobacteria bacterium 45_16_T64]